MIRLYKSPLPPGVNIASEYAYQQGEAFDILVDDCHSKCYICEDKPTKINVEHIAPHRNDPELKYDWANLFIACGHCNSIKGTQFNNILDPTKCDPEEYIALSIDPTEDFVGLVKIETLKSDSSTEQTVELLQKVYNGINATKIQKVESTNLRKEHLMPSVHRFMLFINNYRKEPEAGYDILISNEINRSSIYAAFKRKIIRDNPELSIVFADALEYFTQQDKLPYYSKSCCFNALLDICEKKV